MPSPLRGCDLRSACQKQLGTKRLLPEACPSEPAQPHDWVVEHAVRVRVRVTGSGPNSGVHVLEEAGETRLQERCYRKAGATLSDLVPSPCHPVPVSREVSNEQSRPPV
eukprot:32085-Chlamydomonas_euryale.AAC.2